MPNKSHSIQQPKVAVFDLFRLISSNGIGEPDNAFHSLQPGRRKRSRRTTFSDNTPSATRIADNIPLFSQSARIAVLVESLSDHATNKIISGIEAAAEKTGYEIAILNILGKQRPLTGLDAFEGFIACCSDEAVLDQGFFDKLGKPVVVVGNVKNAGGYHCIKTDYQTGAQLAVNHLIDQGCQKVLMITSENTSANLDKYLGYRDTLKKSGKDWQEPLTFTEPGIESGMEIAAQMFQKGVLPDGVFITNDWVAAGFMKYLKKMEKSLTTKSAVVGFGNESLCEMIEPALCSIDFRKELAGSTALHTLLDQIGDGNLVVTGELTVIEPVLVTRA
ncbi:LacI family DNA-binding transcriptional regulator [Niabella sp. 22666]|uniref:LacI family DNA-binding transcriptional regulator n=1 Tax=Niabella sp. 22666 TaxID=3453954 RepID=UPI003F8380E6